MKANPARSDRSIAKEVGLHNETVAAVRKASEASDEIRHIHPTDRVDAGGRKRARKTAAEKVATAELVGEQVEVLAPKDQPTVTDAILEGADPTDAILEPERSKPIAERHHVRTFLAYTAVMDEEELAYMAEQLNSRIRRAG